MDDTQPPTINVNGRDREVTSGSGRTLLDVLRDDLELTGAKQACDTGECGSCTVLLAGKSAMSCLIDVSRVGAKEVRTIEGMADADDGSVENLHPLQRAFAESGAAQCGYCIPGMIMEAEPLYRRDKEPTRDEIRRRLGRNMCRCTGYTKIIDAVVDAWRARAEPGQHSEKQAGELIGGAVPKADSLLHVTGRSKYAADLVQPGALHIAVVRSPHHHAWIRRIDVTRAEREPGVGLVLTAADLPETAVMLNCRPQPFLLARDKVRFRGEAVVAVAAESAEAAARAADMVEIEYEPIEAVIGPAVALRSAVSVDSVHPNWEDVGTTRRGDVEAAFAEAAVVVEGTYETAPREHAPMEPEAGVAVMEDGVLVIRTPQHHPFAAQQWIAAVLGVEKDRVRIICPAMGGNFGHRGDFLHSALLALVVTRTGRPARIVYTREESLLGSSKSMSYLLRYRTAAAADGTLTALAAEIVGDGGCWIPHPGPNVKKSSLSSVALFAPGPYRVPNVDIRVVEACTNRPRSNPMRGTNIPDLAFAWESQLDMIADRLGLDRLDMRIKNALRVGDQTVTGALLDESVSAEATLEALREPYAAALDRAATAPPDPPWRRGVGVAGIWYVMGGGREEQAGGGWHGLKLGQAKGSAELTADGTFVVRSGVVEKGQGVTIALRQVAAEVLGVPLDDVTLVFGDTALAPYPIGTSGQRTLFHAGGAVQDACTELREAMLEVAAGELGVAPAEVSFVSGAVTSTGGAEISYADLWQAFTRRDTRTAYEAAFMFHRTEHGQGPVYAYAAQLVELDVNVDTGAVRVDRVTYVADPGRVINRQTVEGQVEGGVSMGLSYALHERYVPGETRTLKDYGFPTTVDGPPVIDLLTVENPVVGGPLGAKGIAEMTASAGIASAMNAIAWACGARCFRAPARPEQIAEAIRRGAEEYPDFPMPAQSGGSRR